MCFINHRTYDVVTKGGLSRIPIQQASHKLANVYHAKVIVFIGAHTSRHVRNANLCNFFVRLGEDVMS